MSKFIWSAAIGGASWLLYRSVTAFETNLTVWNKQEKTCMFGYVTKYTVDTDKGQYVVANDLTTGYAKNLYDTVKVGEQYHVRGYGLKIPIFHLHQRLIHQNGTPCDLNHCQEKPSLWSQISHTFS